MGIREKGASFIRQGLPWWQVYAWGSIMPTVYAQIFLSSEICKSTTAWEDCKMLAVKHSILPDECEARQVRQDAVTSKSPFLLLILRK